MILCTARVAPEKAVFRPALPLHVQPEFTGEHIATMTYREQLLHPNWQRKRLEIMQRDEFRCQLCMDNESTLHVHHKQYAKGRLAWEYPNDELVTLCEECHEAMGEQQGMLRDVTAKLPVDGPGCVSNATTVLAGWAHGSQGLNFEHFFQADPHRFAMGEIANALDDKVNLEDTLDLLDAISNAPRWVVRDAVSVLVATCRKRKDEAPSPEYVRRMEGDF